jgi:hypothetical protein
MIVDSMTHAEVYQELERDREAMTRWWHHNLWNQRRRALKCTRFPLQLWFEYTSPRKVHYLFYTRIFDKRMKKILTGIAALRRTSDGMTIYTNWLGSQKLIHPMVLTPHFWKRYAERAKIKKTGMDLIKHYFVNNPHGKDTNNQNVMARSVRYNGEEHLSNCVPDGVMLGQMHGDIFVVKTFITYDMCCGLQQKEFEFCRNMILNEEELYREARARYVHEW